MNSKMLENKLNDRYNDGGWYKYQVCGNKITVTCKNYEVRRATFKPRYVHHLREIEFVNHYPTILHVENDPVFQFNAIFLLSDVHRWLSDQIDSFELVVE